MREMMESLLALQTLELGVRKSGKETERSRLRAAVPEPVLAHFDRLLARGKKGVAVIRQGVCSECHIRVPMGTMLTLAHGTDIQICGNCGRYLHLPEGELPGVVLKSGGRAEAKPAGRRVRDGREPALASA